MDLTAIIVIIVAVLALGLVWRVITGTIRLVLTLVVLAIGGYLLLTLLG